MRRTPAQQTPVSDPEDATTPGREDWLDARAAARLLDVKRATLYAYVSRGWLTSRARPGSRSRLYRREDLLALRARRDARRGHGPVAASALRWGDPVLDSAITRVDPVRGPYYRGQSACAQVDAGTEFETVAARLLDVDTLGPLQRPALPFAAVASLLPNGADLVSTVATALSVWSARRPVLLAQSPEGRATLGAGALPVVALATVLAVRGAGCAAAASREPTVARMLIKGFGGASSTRRLRAVNAALVLVADHELNASTFAARVAASAGATPVSSLGAALSALGGARHGGATDRIEALVEDVGDAHRAPTAVDGRLRRGEGVVGFGHPLYEAGDPRAVPLLDLAASLGGRKCAVRTMLAIRDSVRVSGGDGPTVDYGLVALRHALGWPEGAALALFASGRAAGWLAHAIEQAQSDQILRPRARYVGP